MGLIIYSNFRLWLFLARVSWARSIELCTRSFIQQSLWTWILCWTFIFSKEPRAFYSRVNKIMQRSRVVVMFKDAPSTNYYQIKKNNNNLTIFLSSPSLCSSFLFSAEVQWFHKICLALWLKVIPRPSIYLYQETVRKHFTSFKTKHDFSQNQTFWTTGFNTLVSLTAVPLRSFRPKVALPELASRRSNLNIVQSQQVGQPWQADLWDSGLLGEASFVSNKLWDVWLLSVAISH